MRRRNQRDRRENKEKMMSQKKLRLKQVTWENAPESKKSTIFVLFQEEWGMASSKLVRGFRK